MPLQGDLMRLLEGVFALMVAVQVMFTLVGNHVVGPHSCDSLHILDFGGALGSISMQWRAGQNKLAMAVMPAVLSLPISWNKQTTVAEAEVIRLARIPFLAEFDQYLVVAALQVCWPLCVKRDHA